MAIYFFLAPTTPPDLITAGADSVAAKGTALSESEASSPGKSAAAHSFPGETNKKPGINWARFAKLLDTGSSTSPGESWPRATANDLENFIARHGENAANLVAAFENSHDRLWLERALQLFPNDPRVLLSAIGFSNSGEPADLLESRLPATDRRDLIERFKAADPNNPVPWLFAAQGLFNTKQTDEAISEIRAALQRPAFYTYSNERIAASRQIYEDLGFHPLEADIVATFGLTLYHMSAAQQSSRSLMELQKNAVESGNTASAEEAIQLTYSLGRMFATPEASRTLIGQLVGVSMERRALEALPPDAQRDYLPVTPQQRLAELEKQKQTVKELVPLTENLIRSRDETLLAEYFRRNNADGELSALMWLKAKQQK